MSVSNIICKFSSFANYNELDYNKKDVISILEAFDDPTFAPGIINELSPDGSVKQRMQFTAQNGLFLISINSGRIDIQLTSNEKSGFDSSVLPSIANNLAGSLDKLYTIFSGRAPLSQRLAWNTSYVYFEISEDEKNRYRNRFLML